MPILNFNLKSHFEIHKFNNILVMYQLIIKMLDFYRRFPLQIFFLQDQNLIDFLHFNLIQFRRFTFSIGSIKSI